MSLSDQLSYVCTIDRQTDRQADEHKYSNNYIQCSFEFRKTNNIWVFTQYLNENGDVCGIVYKFGTSGGCKCVQKNFY